MRLFGRETECATLDDLVAGIRHGRSASAVLRGEAGVGKTALLRHAQGSAPGGLAINGAEAESTFSFAALHRLLIPCLPERARLPQTQRAALEVACGLADGPPPDLFLVSLAALTLLAAEPRLCVLDDAQWLDRESLLALAFVARRLHAEGVVLLFGWRAAPGDDFEQLAGVPVIEIGGLGRDAAVALLADVAPAPLDPGLAEEIAVATGGNPLALTDLGQELSTAQLGGASPLTEPAPIGSRLEAHYSAAVRRLPEAAQTWLLLAAAGAGATGGQILEAAAGLGIGPADAEPAEDLRLVAGTPPVDFRHPLVRSAVYGDAPAGRRRAVHRALAVATTHASDADRRAWHLAAAATGLDEEVAAELERCAERAGARGGVAARATFLTRAAELSPAPADRAARTVAAAEAAVPAGAPARALRLLDEVDDALLSGPRRGSALMTRAMASVTTGTPGALRDAAAMCLAAAGAFGDAEPDRTREAVLLAMHHSITAEDLMRGVTGEQIAEAARRLAGPDPSGPADLLLAGFAAFLTGGIEQGAPAMRRAIAALTGPELLLSHFQLGVTLCTLLWDDESRRVVLRGAEDAARRSGALHTLDLVHFMAAMDDATLGRLRDADRHDAVGQRLRTAIGVTADQELIWRHPELVAWRSGPADRAALLPALDVFDMLGVGAMRSVTLHSIAVLDIACADYASAKRLLQPMVELGRPGRYARVLPDLVECALRSGDRRTAALAHADLAVAAGAAGTTWADGLQERSKALLSSPDGAEPHYRSAIEILSGTRAVGDLARAHLLYGEWLRRRRRRRDARLQLRAALEVFEAEKAHAFAARARAELSPLGETGPTPVPESETALTPQEAAVARLARGGGTNAEIAAHLFLSASTVDYHLRKVYRKLGVRSRRQLREALHD
ncbi:AAA family ATPase [Paractinoplanes atraurantiacus]|uniref:Regulatory protein, luxR family n=1 Tax=Paractinoplanes atraurantiacus TaxID=1036182 RepID=A0A285FPP0_9ACTN|nr:LuxR family transcriptional regulator [Actinoplanes atraurantiacus]SNY13272.1 regulatory protein, luxR family [Actinoplanes atraurantiacus]